jgi:hypothetical protein
LSPIKTSFNKTNFNSQLRFSKEDLLELINTLKKQIDIGHRLEMAKYDLFNRTNFSVQDAY